MALILLSLKSDAKYINHIPLNKELVYAVSYINSRYMYMNVNRYIHARKLKGLLAPKGEINLTQLREDHAVELVFQNHKPSLNRRSYISRTFLKLQRIQHIA